MCTPRSLALSGSLVAGLLLVACDRPASRTMNTKQPGSSSYNPLTQEEAQVILKKGTERPGVGEYTDNKSTGTYVCRQCNTPLYRSSDKFESHCGWPSF